MEEFTRPAIAEAQHTDRSRARLAAQAVVYGDVKRARATRTALIVAAALALSVVTLTGAVGTAAVGGVGGVLVLLVSVAATVRERRRTDLAVSMQEEFDTTVFELPWNAMCVPHRPTGQEVHEAAERYGGNRTHDWYPDTGCIRRPLDVLICQQSNLGWGASVHRRWFWTLTAATVALAVALALLGWAAGTDLGTAMNGLVLPFLPVFTEAVTEIVGHHDSATRKTGLQQQVSALWQEALRTDVTLDRVRDVQNEIVHVRRANAQVPDWFDKRLRGGNEQVMRATAAELVAEAAAHGKAEPPDPKTARTDN